MPTLEIQGRDVEVDAKFLKLSPKEQNDFVGQIAASLGIRPAGGAQKSGPSPRQMTVPASDPMGNMTGDEQQVEAVQAEPSALRDQMDDITKGIGGGLVRGAAGTAGMVTDTLPSLAVSLGDYLAKRIPGIDAAEIDRQAAARDAAYDKSSVGRALSTRNIQDGIERVTGPAYEPETRAGKIAGRAAEFVPGGMIGKLPNVVRNAIAFGAVPGAASEVAGQAFEGGPMETPARIAGGLAGAGASLAALRNGPAANLVRDAVKGATNEQIDLAEQLFNQAQRIGVPISQAEALQAVTKGATKVGDLQHTVEGMGGMKEFYAGRPASNEAAARQSFDTIAPPSRDPSSIGPTASRAAEGHIDDVRSRINDASKPFYDRARGDLISPAEMQNIKGLPGYDAALETIQKDPQLARYVRGLPENSVIFQDEIKKQLQQSSTNAASGITGQQNMQRSAGFGADATAVRDAAKAASPDYDAALAIQSGARQQILQPILDGPIGKLANTDATTKTAIDALFPSNPVPNTQGEITTAVRALSRQRPGIANDLVRAHAEMTFNEATQRLASGGLNQSGGAKFAAVLRGESQQAANLEAAVRALPNGGAVWKGFNDLLDVMEAQQYRQATGSRTAFKIPGVEDLKGGGILNNTAQIVGGGGLKLPQKVMGAIQNWNVGRNVDELADLLTNPEAAQRFRQLAKLPAGSSQFTAILTRLSTIALEGKRSGERPRVYITEDRDGN